MNEKIIGLFNPRLQAIAVYEEVANKYDLKQGDFIPNDELLWKIIEDNMIMTLEIKCYHEQTPRENL